MNYFGKNLLHKYHQPLIIKQAGIFTSISHKQSQPIKQNASNITKRITDKVSAIPHPVSKLRLFSYAIPEDETDYEKRLRERRISIQNYNHEYWTQINTSFNMKKKQFIENELKGKSREEVDYTSPQTHEELAQFYKRFLDENHKRYIDYNFRWYRNNLSLLWPSLVAVLIRLKIRLKNHLIR